MKAVRFVQIIVAAAVALVAGCAGALPSNTPTMTLGAVGTGSKTFRYEGKKQSFIVPSGVTQINVAASGAGSPSGDKYRGGKGGLLKATIAVTPGEKLGIFVGGAGVASTGGSGGSGGFNGGGASDVRQGGNELKNRVIVAGGGGGAGGSGGYYGAVVAAPAGLNRAAQAAPVAVGADPRTSNRARRT
jgi:hypothetical protein